MVYPFQPLTVSSVLRENGWKVVLCGQALYISKLMIMGVTRSSCTFLRVVKKLSIHRLQLGFVNSFIAEIRLIFFTNLNVKKFCKFLCDIVSLKRCSKWASNEPDFCPLLRRCWTSEKWPSNISLNIWCVLHIQIASQRDIFISYIKHFLLYLPP